jgi:hypothetical protein
MENSTQPANVSMSVEPAADSHTQQANNATQQVTQETQSQQQAQQSQQEMVNVPVGLLQNVINILDIISARGVFKTAEYAGVGSVYNNLSILVNKKA